MPKIQNMPPAPPAASSIDYASIKSVWFRMDPEDPNSEVRSGIVQERDLDSTPKTLTVKSGKDIVSLEIGYDVIFDAPPAGASAPVAPAPEAVPEVAHDFPALGSVIRFKTSVGVEQGTVQTHDTSNGTVMVLKPGNTKQTRVALDKIVAHPTDAPAPAPAPEVVTPTVEAPAKAAPAPAPAAPPAAPAPAQVPAARAPMVPAAGGKLSERFSNMAGDVLDDPDLLETPRLLIAQGVKDHELLGMTKGSIYLGMGSDASGWVCLAKHPGKVKERTPNGLALAVLYIDSYMVEDVPYGEEKSDKSMPLIARTDAERAIVQPRAEFEFKKEARCLVAVEKPEGVESDHFRFPIGGKLWALASFKAGNSGYKGFLRPVVTRVKLGNKPPEAWHFKLFSELVEGQNIFGAPIMVGHGEWPADVIAEFEPFIPKK